MSFLKILILHKMRSLTIKFFILSILVLAVYLFLFYLFMEVWYYPKTTPVLQKSIVLPYVLVHLDLKGAPPKLKYLESLLPMLKDNGANGLLIEYEDMFQYEGQLANLSSRNCYDRIKLKKFLHKAVRAGFEVIPLVQTFGHLEHALKLKEFRHLREEDMYPDSICPSRPESKDLVKNMLEQVIFFHTNVKPLKYVHIGCDEVFHINKCNECRNKNISRVDLFLSYVKEIADVVKSLSPSTTVLIWDDMLRSIKVKQWNDFVLPDYIEPVYWDYGPSLSVSHINMLKYHKKFQNIWIASAFKGADGRTATLPHFKNRFLNHFSWINFISDYKFGGENKIHNFKGIILTGWSRYSHMDPLCELLPPSIPSLVLNLALIKRFRTGIIVDSEFNSDPEEFYAKYLDAEINKSLRCESETDFSSLDNTDNIQCAFESTDIYNTLQRYVLVYSDIRAGLENPDSGLFAVEYYSMVNTINMNVVFANIDWCKNILQELTNVKMKLGSTMGHYYDDDCIDEYINYKIATYKTKLDNIIQSLNNYTKMRIWERRPIQITM